MTADWYGGWARGAAARDLCLDQIDAYQCRVESAR